MMLGWHQTKSLEPQAFQATLGAYAKAVDDIAAEHVEAACLRIQAGRTPANPAFPPSTAELATEAKRIQDDAGHAEWRARQRVTREPEPYHTPESRAAMKAKVAALMGELKSARPANEAMREKRE